MGDRFCGAGLRTLPGHVGSSNFFSLTNCLSARVLFLIAPILCSPLITEDMFG